MNFIKHKLPLVLVFALILTFSMNLNTVFATDTQAAEQTTASVDNGSVIGSKALSSAIAIGLAAGAAAIGMGIAIGKATEGISRQPEAESKIRTSLMLGLVFIETVVIYALIVAILVIFVL